MLYLIGLGLGGERDITLAGLDAIKTCEAVYLESYTSVLNVSLSKMEALYGCSIQPADRETIEQRLDSILECSLRGNVAILVVGDPFSATTHADLYLRAKTLGCAIQVIHNTSILTAVGSCGLSLYNFGQTISLVFFTETWRPNSFYARLKENTTLGLHTLCLLDIKVKEQSEENLARGRLIYEPPRFMSVQLAAQQLLLVEEELGQNAYGPDTWAVGLARMGAPDQQILVARLKDFANGQAEMTSLPPLHSLVLIGKRLHEVEKEMLRLFLFNKSLEIDL